MYNKNDLAISGQKTVPMLVLPTGGKHATEATATFRVAEVRVKTTPQKTRFRDEKYARIWDTE